MSGECNICGSTNHVERWHKNATFIGTVEVTMGEYIRLMRERRCMSIGDMAKAAGLSRNTITAVERDEANVTLDTLGAIFQALQMQLKFRGIKPPAQEARNDAP